MVRAGRPRSSRACSTRRAPCRRHRLRRRGCISTARRHRSGNAPGSDPQRGRRKQPLQRRRVRGGRSRSRDRGTGRHHSCGTKPRTSAGSSGGVPVRQRGGAVPRGCRFPLPRPRGGGLVALRRRHAARSRPPAPRNPTVGHPASRFGARRLPGDGAPARRSRAAGSGAGADRSGDSRSDPPVGGGRANPVRGPARAGDGGSLPGAGVRRGARDAVRAWRWAAAFDPGALGRGAGRRFPCRGAGGTR